VITFLAFFAQAIIRLSKFSFVLQQSLCASDAHSEAMWSGLCRTKVQKAEVKKLDVVVVFFVVVALVNIKIQSSETSRNSGTGAEPAPLRPRRFSESTSISTLATRLQV